MVHHKDVAKKVVTYLHHNKKDLLQSLLIILVAFSAVNAYLLYSINAEAVSKEAAATEAARPAVLTAIELVDSSCADCSSLTTFESQLFGASANITSKQTVEASSDYGKQLIAQYHISKLPSMILTGELTKSTQLETLLKANGELSSNSFYYTAAAPPYVDVVSGKVAGRVTVTQLYDPGCSQCGDMGDLINNLVGSGVKFTEQKKVTYNSTEGLALVAKYNIKYVPALIFSPDASAYPVITTAWAQVGTVAGDGYYITNLNNPPYRDVANNTVRGLVTLVKIVDKSCVNCYDVDAHKQIIPRFGISLSNIVNETEYDVADAKALLSKYNITSVPTILLSPDSSIYPLLLQVWPSVGTVESDGWFVFRETSVMGNATSVK